ncbi:MAG TPA: outer membrane beta-barrel protein [Pyrinomonadaceae bacterium]|nr:outer membrane beta-barrel protein [Pyrinomonadaceae bacterium]
MNKLIKAMCLSIVLSVAVFAQTDNTDEYNKNEFYVGYSNQQVDGGRRTTFNGFEASYTRNVSRFFGIKGSVSGAYRNNRFGSSVVAGTTVTTFTAEQDQSLYNFLGGVQIKDNASQARFKPFAHALVGVAHTRSKISNVVCQGTNCPPPSFSSISDTGFGGAFGGGLDIKINDRFDFRAIQVDYNPVYTRSTVDSNIRFGIGIVIK